MHFCTLSPSLAVHKKDGIFCQPTYQPTSFKQNTNAKYEHMSQPFCFQNYWHMYMIKVVEVIISLMANGSSSLVCSKGILHILNRTIELYSIL